LTNQNHLGSYSEREALLEQYPAHTVEWLNEVLGIVEQVESRLLTANEARILLKQRFVTIAEEFMPECAKRVAAYQARIRAEQAEITRVSVLAYERRESMRLAEEQRNRDQAAAHDKSQRDAYERDQEQARAHREKFAQEERERQAVVDKKMQAEAEELERRLKEVGLLQ
jgi:Mg-chelatase subunit ChlI